MTRSFDLTGLDGTNPLGFLAALGTLVTLNRSGETGARLRWKRTRTWVPVLEGVSPRDEAELSRVIGGALRGRPVPADAEQRREAAQKEMEAAKGAVRKKGEEIRGRGLSRNERAEVRERELRPLKRDRQQKRERWLEALRQAVPRPELALGKRIDCTPEEYRNHAAGFLSAAGYADREALDLLAAFGSDAFRTQRSDAIEATPFCFITGSGRQFFLDTVRELTARATEERVNEVLFRPWEYRDEKYSMRWDPVEDRRYALLDRDPTASDNKPRTVWMANLLAYSALALYPTAPTRRGLAATGWTLDEGSQAFTWPLWEMATAIDTVRTMLQLPELMQQRPDRSLVRSRGIVAVYRAQRIAVGAGTKRKINFAPPQVV